MDIDWEKMQQAAYQATKQAYVPYSTYRVGACLLTASGQLYTGCNIENASFGLTNCAERTAIFKAISEGESNFVALVVVNQSEDYPFPCGACRQVLSEFCSQNMPVRIANIKGEFETYQLSELLPHAFLKKQVVSSKESQ